MKFQPKVGFKSDDVVQTPPELARLLVDHFKPSGLVLEPCRGEGNIFRLLPKGSQWCEISQGRDFFTYTKECDWILTNPPWSQIRPFLGHAMKLSLNVVFLLTVNHIWTKARLRDIRYAGFGIRKIALVDTPDSFPQSGFQLGAVHLQRGYTGEVKITDL